MPGTRLDQTSLAEKSGLHSQRHLTKDTAETYLDAMWSHYLVGPPCTQFNVDEQSTVLRVMDLPQIERDIYITIVVRQVGEHHFLRHISRILPKNLEENEREILVRNNTVEEARKIEIEKEIAV